MDYVEAQKNYGIEEENEVDAVNLDEDNENIAETPAVGDANVRSESVNLPSRHLSRLERSFKDLDEFYEELIEQHHNPNKPKSMEGDIVDLLLQLKKEKPTPIDLTLEDIKGILMNVLVAGSDTSAAVVVWAMTELVKNPKVMKKV
ncbi:Cytochrome [Capsicum chinense]|nr:Cytochrome [Capsicum chinense]